MATYIVYLYETESELNSSDVSNLRTITVRAENESEAMIEAHEMMEIYEQYDPYKIHSIKKAP